MGIIPITAFEKEPMAGVAPTHALLSDRSRIIGISRDLTNLNVRIGVEKFRPNWDSNPTLRFISLLLRSELFGRILSDDLAEFVAQTPESARVLSV